MTGNRFRARVSALATLLVLLVAGCGETPEPGASAKPRSTVPASAASAPKAPVAVELVWPTPNDVYFRGGGLDQFIQPTVSGEVGSGLFGSVRSGGRQFHEGLDLFPASRDKKGEPLDTVGAAMPGVVRHISSREGASSYGRYVVLEHPEQSPPVYTLYAHLARIAPGLRIGQMIAAGGALGTMGRSAGGYSIPTDRAHLHFEIGVRVTDRFQEWYQKRGFGSPNEHGLWNGMNLMGLDPLGFFARKRAGDLRSLDEVFSETPTALTVRAAASREPDFVRRYPSLVKNDGSGLGWEIDFSATGVPLRWRRLSHADDPGLRPGTVRILSSDTQLLAANRGRKLVATIRGQSRPGADLETVLGQLGF